MPRRSTRRPNRTLASIRLRSARPGGAAQAPNTSLRRSTPRRPPVFRPLPDFGPISVSPDHLDLTLPIPPSINHQYATVNGRRILSATGRAYKTQVAQQILLALARTPLRDQLLQTIRSEFLSLSIRFHFSAPLRRDVDGGLKITQDALCEALGINDNRILDIHLSKAQDATHPRTDVSLFRSSRKE